MSEYKCPRCNSDNTYAYQVLESGSIRYRCRQCEKRWTPKKVYQNYSTEKINQGKYNCPSCGSLNTYSRESNYRQFCCSDCDRRWTPIDLRLVRKRKEKILTSKERQERYRLRQKTDKRGSDRNPQNKRDRT